MTGVSVISLTNVELLWEMIGGVKLKFLELPSDDLLISNTADKKSTLQTREGYLLSKRADLSIKSYLENSFDAHVTLNNEAETLEYEWDIEVKLDDVKLRLETKHQPSQTYFTLLNGLNQTCFSHWKKYDLMLGWRVLNDNEMIVWCVLSNELQSPTMIKQGAWPFSSKEGNYHKPFQWLGKGSASI